MDAEPWIETATTALRKLAAELRGDASKFRRVAGLLESIAERAPKPAKPTDPPPT